MRIVHVAHGQEQIGGVSRHAQSLHQALGQYDVHSTLIPGPHGAKCRIALQVPGFVSRTTKALRHADILHVHSSSWAKYALGGALPTVASARRSVLSLHTGRFPGSKLYGPYIRSVLGRFDGTVVMSQTVADNLRMIVGSTLAERVRTCSPFIPGGTRREPRSNPSAPVVCSGLWRPLYQYDDAIDILTRVRQQGYTNRLVLMVSTAGMSPSYRARVVDRIRDLAWVELREDQDLSSALDSEEWSCLLRVTSSDSFGLAVHEALWHGIPAVATAVGVRPSGTITFRPGVLKEGTEGVLFAIEQPDALAASISAAPLRSGVRDMLDIYHGVCRAPS